MPELRRDPLRLPVTVGGGGAVARVGLDDPRLAECWRNLQREGAVPSPFLSWEWFSAFADVPEVGTGIEVLIWPADGTPAALLPLEQTRGAGRVRTIGFAGWQWLAPDHLDVIAASEVADDAAIAFLRHLAARRDWDVLDLDGLRADSALVRHARSAFARGRFLRRADEPIEVPYLALGKDASDEVLFSSNTRWRARQDIRAAEEAGGAFEVLDDPSTIMPALDELMDLHRARFGPASRVYATPFRREFHRVAAQRMAQAGMLRVYRLRFGDVAAAVSYVPVWNGSLYFYGEGLRPGLGKRSPGLAVKVRAISEAASDGIRRADFCRGDHEWKRRLTDDFVTDVRMRVVRISARTLAAGARSAARRSWYRFRGEEQAG